MSRAEASQHGSTPGCSRHGRKVIGRSHRDTRSWMSLPDLPLAASSAAAAAAAGLLLTVSPLQASEAQPGILYPVQQAEHVFVSQSLGVSIQSTEATPPNSAGALQRPSARPHAAALFLADLNPLNLFRGSPPPPPPRSGFLPGIDNPLAVRIAT